MSDNLLLTRRSFLKLASAAVAAGVVIPALTPPRTPYVSVGEGVSYIGLNKHPAPTFTGSALVKDVGDWDGVGYPCTLWNQSYGPAHGPMTDRFHDVDLCNFTRELPARFWAEPANRRFPNVHAFIRERRFGELPDVMWERLGYQRTAAGWMVPGGWIAWT